MRTYTKKLILAGVPALIAVVLLIAFVTQFMHYEHIHEVERLADGWRLVTPEGTWEDAALEDLPSLIGRRLNRGEIIRAERVMTDDLEESPTLELMVNYFAVEVFLEEEKVASIAMDRLEKKSNVGGNRYFVDLPAEHQGQTLSIVYHAGENLLSPVLYPPRFSSFHSLVHSMMQRYGYALLIGVFMCLFGGFFLFFSLAVSVLIPEITGQRISSLLCIVFGVWILTHYRVLALFVDGSLNMTVEYVCFYASLPLLYHLVARIHETGKVYHLMKRLTWGFIVIAVVLHGPGILYMHRLRYAYYALCTAFLVLLLTMYIKDLRSGNSTPVDLIQMASPVLFCTMIFIAMCINFPTGENIEEQTVSIVILTTGPLLFAMARFLVYNWMMVESAPKKFAFASLRELAYTDSMTGLHNRTHMTERYEALDKSSVDYCLVSLDLNGLKYVNDTYGHGEGDRLIRAFAQSLKEVLPPEADAMRIGGDEFLVISETMDEHALRGCLMALDRKFSSLDQTDSGIPHSVSYGYAFRHEFPEANAHGVYLRADERMYAQKHASSPGG